MSTQLQPVATDGDAAVAQELTRCSHARPPALPMPDAAAVAAWEPLIADAVRVGAAAVLLEQFAQLRLPIRTGMSRSAAYASIRLPGGPPPLPVESVFVAPAQITLALAASPAGRIPVIACVVRADFERVVQAITHRNEPVAVPPSMGACLVCGYVNWTRVHAATNPQTRSSFLVPTHDKRTIAPDSFVLLSTGAYSAVPAEAMQLSTVEWERISLDLRLRHELAHYLCKRALGDMRNALLDELAADYAAIAGHCGELSGGWLRRFLGVEHYPAFREGGRLANYGAAQLRTAQSWATLQQLVVRASEALETFDRARIRDRTGDDALDIAWATLAIMRTGLETLCSRVGAGALHREWLALRSTTR